MGHQGSDKTDMILRQNVYWPGMHQEVKEAAAKTADFLCRFGMLSSCWVKVDGAGAAGAAGDGRGSSLCLRGLLLPVSSDSLLDSVEDEPE
jgi:hypothetical protein